MSVPSVPPPIYSQQVEGTSALSGNIVAAPTEAQLLISPSPNSVHFQKGFLGADDHERAAIEGELHIKGINSDDWESVFVPNHRRLPREAHTCAPATGHCLFIPMSLLTARKWS